MPRLSAGSGPRLPFSRPASSPAAIELVDVAGPQQHGGARGQHVGIAGIDLQGALGLGEAEIVFLLHRVGARQHAVRQHALVVDLERLLRQPDRRLDVLLRRTPTSRRRRAGRSPRRARPAHRHSSAPSRSPAPAARAPCGCRRASPRWPARGRAASGRRRRDWRSACAGSAAGRSAAGWSPACRRPGGRSRSWTSKMSVSWSSYCSAQSWVPLAASVSCTVTRTRSPMRRTLPPTR